MVLQLSCWVSYSNICSSLFFLDLWRDPFGPPSSCSRLIGSLVWISSRLWLCGLSKIESKFSWFWWLSLPVAWSHPSFVRYKASYPTVRSKLLSSVHQSTVMVIRPPSRRFLVIWYQSIHCHGSSHHNPHINLWFTHHILLFCSSPKVH